MTITFTVPGTPIPKPRQSRSDRWKVRDCVARYRAYADLVRIHANRTPGFDPAPVSAQLVVTCYFPMAAAWSNRKKTLMTGKPHTQTPDASNLLKAVEDALFSKDEVIWDSRCIKYWDDGRGARTEIRIVYQ